MKPYSFSRALNSAVSASRKSRFRADNKKGSVYRGHFIGITDYLGLISAGLRFAFFYIAGLLMDLWSISNCNSLILFSISWINVVVEGLAYFLRSARKHNVVAKLDVCGDAQSAANPQPELDLPSQKPHRAFWFPATSMTLAFAQQLAHFTALLY